MTTVETVRETATRCSGTGQATAGSTCGATAPHDTGHDDQREYRGQLHHRFGRSTCPLVRADAPSSSEMDISPVFNDALVRHKGAPLHAHPFDLERLDQFLQEAYRIVCAPSDEARPR